MGNSNNFYAPQKRHKKTDTQSWFVQGAFTGAKVNCSPSYMWPKMRLQYIPPLTWPIFVNKLKGKDLSRLIRKRCNLKGLAEVVNGF